MDTNKYGRFYWLVKMVNGDEVLFHADQLRVIDGAIVGTTTQKDGDNNIMFSAGPGQWVCAHAASTMDGGAIAVDHWVRANQAKRRKTR